MKIDLDSDRAREPLSRRERIGVKLVLLLIGMIWPAKYEHQIKQFLESIHEEFK